MTTTIPPAALDAILDRAGHEPCPGVEIERKRPLGRAPCRPGVPAGECPELHATLFRPAARPASPAPALLSFHGGGFQAGSPDSCGALAKALAVTLGVTTVSASYRLATATQPTFPGVLDDALHAWRWVQAHAGELGIDRARVAVSGESAGVLLSGHLAVASPFMAYAAGEQRPVAFVCQWGPLDFVARWFDRNESPGAEQALLGAHYAENPACYHQASPLAYATGPLPPALFVYGRQDAVVHPRQGRLGFAAWKAAGRDAELLVVPNIGHGTEGDNRPQRQALIQAAVDFLSTRLARNP